MHILLQISGGTEQIAAINAYVKYINLSKISYERIQLQFVQTLNFILFYT